MDLQRLKEESQSEAATDTLTSAAGGDYTIFVGENGSCLAVDAHSAMTAEQLLKSV